MSTCIFCGRPAHRYAVTVHRAEAWERLVEPVCARCHVLLTEAGADGRKLKATGEMWYVGHRVGVYEAPQFLVTNRLSRRLQSPLCKMRCAPCRNASLLVHRKIVRQLLTPS